jgi:hypothetical protein
MMIEPSSPVEETMMTGRKNEEDLEIIMILDFFSTELFSSMRACMLGMMFMMCGCDIDDTSRNQKNLY